MTFAEWVAVARDIALLVLALLGIGLSAALLFLSLLLYRQARPLLRRANQMLDSTHGTTASVGEAVARPLIRTAALAAGTRGALGVLGRLRGGREARRS